MGAVTPPIFDIRDAYVNPRIRFTRISDVLRTLMPRISGQAYPIDDEWRARVRSAMDRLGMSQADLARAAGCAFSTISELLSGNSKESPILPRIHLALGWTPPRLATLSGDAEVLMSRWDQLDKERRARLLERAEMLLEETQGDDKKR